MKITLPAREAGSALVAYVLLFVLPLLLALSMLSDVMAARASLAERLQQIERLQAARGAPSGGAMIAPAGPGLFAAETATLSVAEMQKRITDILVGHGASILTSQATTTPDGALRRLQVSLELVVPESGLADLLYSLEVDRPFLFVDALSIQTREDAGASDRLRLTLRLQGFAREAS